MKALNIKVVNAVAKHRVLYDHSAGGYSRREDTDKAWNEVAAEVNLTVLECKDKWTNLRTAFVRGLRALPTSSSGATHKKLYYLHDAMKFILPFTKTNNPVIGNLPKGSQQSEETDTDDQELPPSPQSEFSENQTLPLQDQTLTPPSKRKKTFTVAHKQSINLTCSPKRLPQCEPTELKNEVAGKNRNKYRALKSDIESVASNYCTATTSKPQQEDVKQDAIQQFLNSLVPDLIQLDYAQLRSFKRRTLLLIDEVLGTAPLETKTS